MEKTSGIYSITHISNGKMYIGSAIDIEKRWSEHRTDLNHNKHDNPRLQNSWNKYGETQFNFRLLEEVKDLSKLLDREQYWIDSLHSSDRNKGFNIRIKAESNLGLKHTEETKDKMSQSSNWRGQDHSGTKNAFFGREHSEESKERMSKPKSKEGKAAIKVARLEWAKNHYKDTVCLFCNVTFKQRLCETKKFCTKKCSSKYYGRIKTQKSTLKKNCLICPTEFVTNRFQDRKYCGRECWAVSMKGNKNHSK